jgi:hypothetical protein
MRGKETVRAKEMLQAPEWTWPGHGPYSGAAAAGMLVPEVRGHAEREESGRWKRKSLGKDGKIIMVIFLE